jgi:hypothetical protein
MNLSRAVQDVTHSELSTYLSKVAGLILIPRLPRRYSSHTTCATSASGRKRRFDHRPATSGPPDNRTLSDFGGMSQRCQRTKSLRDSPLTRVAHLRAP